MQLATVVCLLMLGFVAACHARPEEKRFFLSDAEKAFNKVKEALNAAKEALKKTVNKSKDEFNKAVSGLPNNVDFNSALKKLKPLITHKTTKIVCKSICTASAAAIMGPEVTPVAGVVCVPLCDAALAELAHLAEQGK